MGRFFNRLLVRDAIQHFNREVTYSELKQFVWAKVPDVHESTLTCQIVICSVNHQSRIHSRRIKNPAFARSNTTSFSTRDGDVTGMPLLRSLIPGERSIPINRPSYGASDNGPLALSAQAILVGN